MPRSVSPLLIVCLLFAGCDSAPPPTAPAASIEPIASPAPGTLAQPKAGPATVDRLPYSRIEAIVQAAAPGDIVEVELEEAGHDGDYGSAAGIYEIKVLTASGRVLELEVDATSGQILKQESE